MQKLNATGATVCATDYTPFGERTQGHSTGIGPWVGEYGFSTKPQNEAGLYYYGYRFYEASLGRWLSRDPLGEEGFRILATRQSNGMAAARIFTMSFLEPLGGNLYLMVGNSTLGSLDYLGLSECCGGKKKPRGRAGSNVVCCGGSWRSKTGGKSCCGGCDDGDMYMIHYECCRNGEIVEKVPAYALEHEGTFEDCMLGCLGTTVLWGAIGYGISGGSPLGALVGAAGGTFSCALSCGELKCPAN